jgi:choline dehydrogenase-like flavoprotein
MTGFDVVIVGAGAAGCLLANRLTRDGKRRVLLLEAGEKEPPLGSRMPGAWITLINTEIDWGYHTVPQRNCFGRRLVWPRGKLVGGSGAMNALIYMRGSPSDYDRWQARGATGWSWQDVLPWFKKSERNARFAGSALHGADGELEVNDVPVHDPVEHLWVEAAQQAGLPLKQDFNDGDQYGCGFFQAMMKDGERYSPADAFLDPILDRPNLTLVTSALATRIVFSRGRATGLEYFRHGAMASVEADEIILAGGSVNSPHLLLLSGVGPAEQLRRAGVTPLHDLPGVGQAMQDHVNVVITYATDEPIGIGGMSEADFAAATDEWLRQRTGPMANPWSSTGGQAKSRPGLPEPDLQIYGVITPHRDHARYFAARPGISFFTILQRPKSVGRLTLRSPDPLAHPALDPDYLSDDGGDDLRTLVDGVRLSRNIASQKALAHLDLREITPSAEAATDPDMALFVRRHCQSIYHPTSTCRMGTDTLAVVDPLSLKVRGVEGLRVIDASVFPDVVASNICATVFMVAERGAAFFLEQTA